MSRLIALDDELYGKLEQVASRHGFDNVENVVAEMSKEESAYRRREAVRQIKDVYAYMKTKYGRMENSVTLIREDRAR
ncbi:MAG TPA: hypothetical protein VFH60_00755 [Chloroflexia bacterium]|nr:hypothetical protein [Chloroflexia bacterium]